MSQWAFWVKHRNAWQSIYFHSIFLFVCLFVLAFLFNFNTFMHLYDACVFARHYQAPLTSPKILRPLMSLLLFTHDYIICLMTSHFIWTQARKHNLNCAALVLCVCVVSWGLHHKFSHNLERFQCYVECQIRSLSSVFLISRRLGLI